MKKKLTPPLAWTLDGNKVKATLPQLLASTHRREVLGKVGGFGGLFALDVKKNIASRSSSRPVDGVGRN